MEASGPLGGLQLLSQRHKMLNYIFEGLQPGELILIAFIKKAEGQIRRHFCTTPEEALQIAQESPEGWDTYFGVCPRATKASTREAVTRALCLWADIDAKDLGGLKPQAFEAAMSLILPPSLIVDSGNGYHAYWLLTQSIPPEEAEAAVKNILALVGAGLGTYDCSRLLRVPNTLNLKDPTHPKSVELIRDRPDLRYDIADLRASFRVPEGVRKRIITGDTRGFPSRSERDFNVARALLQLGMSEEAARIVFEEMPIGDKALDSPPHGGEAYLERTLEKAHHSAAVPLNFQEVNDSWFVPGKTGPRQVSTFVFHPERLLESDGEDLLVGRVRAAGYEWPNVSLPKGAFVNVRTLSGSLPTASWQWVGSDREVRMLLPYLMQRLFELGLPKARATTCIGRHGEYLVTEDAVLSLKGLIRPEDSPYVWVATGREHPRVAYTFPPDEEYVALARDVFRLLPSVNRPGVIFPVLSWFMATPLKMGLEQMGVRFPLLNVFGTRGAGKTSLLLRIFQPLVGYVEPRAYSCATTPFVLLSLLASTNCVPIAFSEFRQSTLSLDAYDKLMRYILLAYDQSMDARGRPDQTVTVYPLTAPFTLDGEDALSNPAAMERSVIVGLSPESIYEGSSAANAFHELVELPLQGFAGRYLQHTLTYNLDAGLEEARRLAMEAFPDVLPDRVRNNLTVCILGYLSLQEFLAGKEVKLPKPNFRLWFGEAIEEVASPSLGRSPVLVDAFVEDIINAVSGWRGTSGQFAYRYDKDINVLWFHLSSVLPWWHRARRSAGLRTLAKPAIKRQLKERSMERTGGPGQYTLDPSTKNCDGVSLHMYGIDLVAAHESGLDIPSRLKVGKLTVTFTPKGEMSDVDSREAVSSSTEQEV